MNGDTFMTILMLGLFILMVTIMITAYWYTKKYRPRISFFQIVLTSFVLIFGCVWLFIWKISKSEEDNIIETVRLKNTIVAIYNQPRKAYFKEMKFDDGTTLPMPENMNGLINVGDSIYKNKGDHFYLIVSAKTKKRTLYKVTVHERVLSKPQ